MPRHVGPTHAGGYHRAMSVVRPRRLSPGDAVAVVSPSWGGPNAFPHVFDHGLAVLRD